MKESRSLRLLAAAGLCTAALLCAACNDNTPPSAPPAPPRPVTTAPAATATPALPTTVSDTVKVAQAKLDEVTQYIKDNKLDSADKALTALEEAKASLPEDIQNKLPELRAALNAAKAKAGTGLKLPGT